MGSNKLLLLQGGVASMLLYLDHGLWNFGTSETRSQRIWILYAGRGAYLSYTAFLLRCEDGEERFSLVINCTGFAAVLLLKPGSIKKTLLHVQAPEENQNHLLQYPNNPHPNKQF